MAGAAVQVSGIILKREPSGEKFERLYLLARERGPVALLMRRPGAKSSSTLPDIFDQVDFLVDDRPGSDFSFVREARILRQRTALGASYPALDMENPAAMDPVALDADFILSRLTGFPRCPFLFPVPFYPELCPPGAPPPPVQLARAGPEIGQLARAQPDGSIRIIYLHEFNESY
ncbi:MAG: hypothetical protein F7B06_08665 [Opitutae bacterium]|nr:hypothetical protein [Opitutae bacterium]